MGRVPGRITISTNIYRIWMPSSVKVISTRDVVFDEQAIFEGNIKTCVGQPCVRHSGRSCHAGKDDWAANPAIHPEVESFFEDMILTSQFFGGAIQYRKDTNKRVRPWPLLLQHRSSSAIGVENPIQVLESWFRGNARLSIRKQSRRT